MLLSLGDMSGLDVGREAIGDCVGKRKASMDEVWRDAEIDRVQNFMRPYLESLA